eukprot:2364298-Rhodomonas_salina.3
MRAKSIPRLSRAVLGARAEGGVCEGGGRESAGRTWKRGRPRRSRRKAARGRALDALEGWRLSKCLRDRCSQPGPLPLEAMHSMQARGVFMTTKL